MIHGAHFLFYSKDPEADRAFFRDVLEFRSVDAGHGWLIFALPPSEAAVHPGSGGTEIYLMCDDLPATMTQLKSRNVECAPVDEARWGSKTTFRLPGGGEIGLYQPRHPTAI